MTVPKYVGDIATDPTVYNSWPANLPSSSWLGFFPGSVLESPCFVLMVDGGEPRSVVELEELPDGVCIAKLTMNFDINSDYVVAGGVWVAPDFRRAGVATFMGVTARTWIADNYGKKFIVDEAWADPIGHLVVEKIKETYQVSGEEVYTNPLLSDGG